MNKKGFTLIELLGVIVILAIIMVIAIPNITSILDKTKRETYISDARKMITQAEYVIRTSDVERPSAIDIVKIRLSYLGTSDVKTDPDGNLYNLDNSYVIVVRKDGYLEYYVNLVADIDDGNKGISLTHQDNLNGNERLKLIKSDFTLPTDSEIMSITGINGTIKTY